MSTTAKEPSNCGCKSCNSKTFIEKGTEVVTLPSRKAVVTTWACLHGHIQQTEKQLPTDEMEALMDAMYGHFPYVI